MQAAEGATKQQEKRERKVALLTHCVRVCACVCDFYTQTNLLCVSAFFRIKTLINRASKKEREREKKRDFFATNKKSCRTQVSVAYKKRLASELSEWTSGRIMIN